MPQRCELTCYTIIIYKCLLFNQFDFRKHFQTLFNFNFATYSGPHLYTILYTILSILQRLQSDPICRKYKKQVPLVVG